MFDPLTRLFEYEKAGHPPPLLLRGEDATPVAGGCMVLGLLPEAGCESSSIQETASSSQQMAFSKRQISMERSLASKDWHDLRKLQPYREPQPSSSIS